MAVLVRIISNNALWIYIACLVAALFLLRTAYLARRERLGAAFNLEREAALNRTHAALRWAILVLAILGATYFVANRLKVPEKPVIVEAEPTPTPVFLIDTPTPTESPTVIITATLPISGAVSLDANASASASTNGVATETPTPRTRATPRPVETATPTPTLPSPTPRPTLPPTATPAPAVYAPSCPDQRAIILEPGVGQRISGPVTLIGTAQTDNFQYLKIEFKPVGAAGEFNFYLRRETSVINGPLGTFDPSGLPAGDYLLRLVTVDITGNFSQCTVQVTVAW